MRFFTKDLSAERLLTWAENLQQVFAEGRIDSSAFKKSFILSHNLLDDVEKEAAGASLFFRRFITDIVCLEKHELEAYRKVFDELEEVFPHIEKSYDQLAESIKVINNMGEEMMVSEAYLHEKGNEVLFFKALEQFSTSLKLIREYENTLKILFDNIIKEHKKSQDELKKDERKVTKHHL